MSIGRVFRRVGKALKKVAGPALAIGAIAFTAGAALGLPAMAGGWGGAVSGALGKVGLSSSSVMGRVLVGAVTQAGYGAAIGGVAAAATGGDITDGTSKGALAGGLSGGIMGAMGMGTDPLARAFGQGGDITAPAASNTLASPVGGAMPAMAEGTGLYAAAGGAAPGAMAPSLPVAGGPAAAAGTGPGWLNNLTGNSGLMTLAGNALAGIGSGGADKLAADERFRLQQAGFDFERDMRGELVAANDGIRDYGQPLPATMNARAVGPTAAPAVGKGRYEYDPALGRIVYKTASQLTGSVMA